MSEVLHGSFRGKASKVEQMVEKAALTGSGDPVHEKVYVNIQDSVLNIIAGLPGNVAVSYCTFTEGEYLDDISVGDEIEENTPDDEVATAEAVLDVEDFLTYLGLASDGGTTEISFHGSVNDRLATVFEAEGALNTRVFIPASEKALEEIPLGTPDKFNGDNQYVKVEGGEEVPLPTEIETTADQVSRVVNVVENDPNLDFYPITVESGSLTLDVGRNSDESRNAVWGELNASEVEGPDVSNNYFEGFKSLFNTLSGNVNLSTAPGGAPLCVVQDGYTGVELRHVLGSTGGD